MGEINENNIAIVVARKNDADFLALLESLKQQMVPENMIVDIIPIERYTTRVAACAYAMQNSNAKYKIYIREDCKIIKKTFLKNLINTFQDNADIGMLGISGTRIIPTHLNCAKAKKRAGKFSLSNGMIMDWSKDTELSEVVAVDDFFIATQYDLPWDEKFLIDDYYGFLSHCINFNKNHYKIKVFNDIYLQLRKFDIQELKKDIIYNAFLEEYSSKIFPLVSVYIPTHNRPEMFQRALSSVINQTYKNLEIVISDSSENNDTEILMKEYMENDHRIKYFHNPGLDSGNNFVFLCKYDNPESEYINWLCDDDGFEINKIETELNFYLEENGISLVTSYRRVKDEYGNFLPDNAATVPVVSKTTRVDGRSAARYLIKNKINYIGEPATVLIKKKYIELSEPLQDPFYDIKWKHLMFAWKDGDNIPLNKGDHQLWLWLLEKGDMIYIREPLCWFGVHRGQLQQADAGEIRKEVINWAWVTVQGVKKGIIDKSEVKTLVLEWLEHWIFYEKKIDIDIENTNFKYEFYRTATEMVEWIYTNRIPEMKYLLKRYKRSE